MTLSLISQWVEWHWSGIEGNTLPAIDLNMTFWQIWTVINKLNLFCKLFFPFWQLRKIYIFQQLVTFCEHENISDNWDSSIFTIIWQKKVTSGKVEKLHYMQCIYFISPPLIPQNTFQQHCCCFCNHSPPRQILLFDLSTEHIPESKKASHGRAIIPSSLLLWSQLLQLS